MKIRTLVRASPAKHSLYPRKPRGPCRPCGFIDRTIPPWVKRHHLPPVLSTDVGDLLLAERPIPYHMVAINPIVCPAGQRPVSDRRIERDGLAIKGQPPTSRSQRGDDL